MWCAVLEPFFSLDKPQYLCYTFDRQTPDTGSKEHKDVLMPQNPEPYDILKCLRVHDRDIAAHALDIRSAQTKLRKLEERFAILSQSLELLRLTLEGKA
jgi:hypothetical protein